MNALTAAMPSRSTSRRVGGMRSVLAVSVIAEISTLFSGTPGSMIAPLRHTGSPATTFTVVVYSSHALTGLFAASSYEMRSRSLESLRVAAEFAL